MHCNQKNLHNALKELARVADQKSSMPALAGVLVEARNGRLTLTTTDLTRFLTHRMDCNGGDFSAVLPAKTLLEIVKPEKSQKSYTVEFSVISEETIKIGVTVDGMTSSFFGCPDFPAVPEDFSAAQIGDASELKTALDYVLPASSDDQGRPHLAGVYFAPGDEIVTTDGHRLHKYTTSVPSPQKALLPNFAMKTLSSLLRFSQYYEVSESASWVQFQIEDFSLAVKKVDAKFPPYEKVIPSEARSNFMTVQSSDLHRALTKIIKATKSKDSKSAVTIAVNGDFRIEGKNAELDIEVETSIPGDHGNGAEISLGLNPKYLLDTLTKKSTSHVIFSFGGNCDAVTMVQGELDEKFAVVMPMRL